MWHHQDIVPVPSIPCATSLAKICPSLTVPSLFQLCMVANWRLCSDIMSHRLKPLMKKLYHEERCTVGYGLATHFLDLESVDLASYERRRARSLVDGLFLWADWHIFFQLKSNVLKAQLCLWTLNGSWWRTVFCLIIPSMKSCWWQIGCYVLYLFLIQ